ncbi:unnamed protein product [Mytilus coruscus]|uniref:Ig-like domain-containing protein n=1 Tax=Mytilus coruscus TaxID=42192 RepID=A0A6J8EGH8_MYTCO|nr:unnamed protein product [Mytilus coruscus]
MKFLLLAVIYCVFAEDTFGEYILSNVSTHTYIGETVVLACNFTYGATNNRWRRLKQIIAKASEVNLKNPNRQRYDIVGQQKNDEYYLQISEVIQSDSGLYWCEMQMGDQITKQRFTLYISESRSTTIMELSTDNIKADKENIKSSTKGVQIQSSTKGVQIKSSTKGVQIKSSAKRVQKTTTVTKTTEQTTDDGRPSGQEQFYYWLLGAGLVLVLCLSVICNVCLNRRCRTKTLEQKAIDKSASDKQLNKLHGEEDNKLNSHGKAIMIQIEEESSMYESIDECKMTHYDYPDQYDIKNIERSPCLPKRRDMLSSSKPSHLDIVDDSDSTKVIGSIGDLSLNRSKSAELSTSCTNVSLNKPQLNNNDGRLSPHLNKGNAVGIVQVHSENKPEYLDLIDGDESADDCDVTSVKTDEYLNPYVPLITGEMEYLHSYTTPIKQELPPINKAKSAIESKIFISINGNHSISKDNATDPYVPLNANEIDYLHTYTPITSECTYTKTKSTSNLESVEAHTKFESSGNALVTNHTNSKDDATNLYVPLNTNEIDYLQTYTPITFESTYSKTMSRCAETSALDNVSCSKNNFLTNEYDDCFSSNTNLSKV